MKTRASDHACPSLIFTVEAHVNGFWPFLFHGIVDYAISCIVTSPHWCCRLGDAKGVAGINGVPREEFPVVSSTS